MIEKKVQSFTYAWKGILIAWREELNFKIQVVIAAFTFFLSFAFKISSSELLFVIISIGAVLAIETLNTALEEFCDMVQSSHDPHVAKIKDLGAGASLIRSIAAFMTGVVIFLPYIAKLI